MTKKTTEFPSSMKALRRLEKTFSNKLNYQSMGNLPKIVQTSQELLLAILANRGAEPFVIDNPSEKAMCAIGVQAFNLARTTVISVSSGYSIQSLIPLRALYERVATGVSFHSDPELATKYLDKEIKAKQIRFASSMKTGVQPVFREYAFWRRQAEIPQEVFDEASQQLPRLYGVLSKFSHPELDIVPMQFLIDEPSQRALFVCGPNKTAIPFGVVTFTFLYLLQFVLGTLLLVEFKDAGYVSWEKIAPKWEQHVTSSAGELKRSIDKINEEYRDG